MTGELLQPEDHSLVFEIAEAVAYGRVDEYPEEAEIVVVPAGPYGGADHG